MNSVRPSDDQLPRPGDVVGGKYRVESVIGAGGMGVVLGAMDTSLGRRVAIKFLMPQKAGRDHAAERFGREARAAASIQSEHVVRIFEVSTLPNGASYIVMEHLAGADLSQVLRSRGALPVEEAVDHLLQACEALGEAHKLGIVHRDLKPQNLFVTQRNDGSPCVKVLDFGISKAIDDVAPNLTATDTVMGTPLYMSPEQVRSLKHVDHRSDIWALGAILFELLTAAPIFEATTMSALCAAIAMDPPTPLRVKRFDAPPPLEAVIQRCLEKDPNARFQDVAELADALAPFASERGRLAASRVARVVRASAMPPPFAGPSQAPYPQGTTRDAASLGGASRSSYVPASQAATAVPSSVAPGSGTGGPMPISHLSIPLPSGSAPSMPMSHAPSYPPPSHPHPSAHPSGHPPTQTGVPPTLGMTSGYPAGGGAALTYDQPAWTPHRTTQQTWQHTGGSNTMNTTAAPGRRASNGLILGGLGLLAGVAVVVVLLGVTAFFVIRGQAVTSSAPADSASPLASAAPGSPASAAAAGALAGGPKKVVVDAGAASRASAVVPGAAPAVAPGAPAAVAPAAPPAAKSKADEDLDQQRRGAQLQCNTFQAILRSNDPKTNNGAKQVKAQACTHGFGPQGNTCERAACRQACNALQDQPCLLQLESAERSFPSKF